MGIFDKEVVKVDDGLVAAVVDAFNQRKDRSARLAENSIKKIADSGHSTEWLAKKHLNSIAAKKSGFWDWAVTNFFSEYSRAVKRNIVPLYYSDGEYTVLKPGEEHPWKPFFSKGATFQTGTHKALEDIFVYHYLGKVFDLPKPRTRTGVNLYHGLAAALLHVTGAYTVHRAMVDRHKKSEFDMLYSIAFNEYEIKMIRDAIPTVRYLTNGRGKFNDPHSAFDPNLFSSTLEAYRRNPDQPIYILKMPLTYTLNPDETTLAELEGKRGKAQSINLFKAFINSENLYRKTGDDCPIFAVYMEPEELGDIITNIGIQHTDLTACGKTANKIYSDTIGAAIVAPEAVLGAAAHILSKSGEFTKEQLFDTYIDILYSREIINQLPPDYGFDDEFWRFESALDKMHRLGRFKGQVPDGNNMILSPTEPKLTLFDYKGLEFKLPEKNKIQN